MADCERPGVIITPPIYPSGGCDLSDYYTKEETNELISGIDTGEFVIVDELPETGEPKNIYLVPKSGGGYTEYAYIDGEWEEIGDTDIDLSGYVTSDGLCEAVMQCEGIINIDSRLSSNETLAEDASTVANEARDGLAGKQDTLTAGDNITITNNTISATVPDISNLATKSEVSAVDTKAEQAQTDATTALAAAAAAMAEAESKIDCNGLSSCQTIIDMNTAINGKQDALTAGDHITITNGTVSATYTKAELLSILGYEEITISKTDSSGNTVTAKVLGYIEE